MELQIIHQMQPTPVSCQHTCAAMIAGIPVNVMFTEEELQSPLSDNKLAQKLAHHGYYVSPNQHDRLMCDETYILTVPSLNIPGGHHAVVLTVNEEGDGLLFDPNKGKPILKYYDTTDDLRSYSVHLRIHKFDAEDFHIGLI